MEKPVSVKAQKHNSDFAKFIAQYAYLQRNFSLGFARKMSYSFAGGEWSANFLDNAIRVVCQYDMQIALNRQESIKQINMDIYHAEQEEALAREALNNLEASIEQVEGKRSMLNKIDKAKQPEMYATEQRKLAEMESYIGHYDGFITQYKDTIQNCEQRVKDAKESLKALPTARESQVWEFDIVELAKIAEWN